jgi:hypothetical protein
MGKVINLLSVVIGRQATDGFTDHSHQACATATMSSGASSLRRVQSSLGAGEGTRGRITANGRLR